MREIAKRSETHGMGSPTPFAWLLGSAAFASLAALALAAWPTPVDPRAVSPVVEASADSYELPTFLTANWALVTESKPALAPAATGTEGGAGAEAGTSTTTGTLEAGTTPGGGEVGTLPLPLVAVAPVATLPAGLEAQEALDADPGKEAALFDMINAARIAETAGVLERDDGLDGVALARARNLIENGYFDHYAPDGTSAFSELAARGLPYRLAGENLARNNYPSARTVQAAFEGLMASPGHRANIMEPRFGAVGLATVKHGGFWLYVMVFTNPR
jgi:uncharacterized protein YkwD